MQIDLSDRVALVTGASRGIGRAVARALGSAGARVALHANRNVDAAQDLAAEIGNGATVFQADLGDAPACDRLMPDVIGSLGGLDVLVNNAGLALEAPLELSDDHWLSAWDTTMHVNLRAAAQLSRAAIRYWTDRGTPGRMIHIASRAAFRGDTAEYLAYAASKGGMVALSRSIARAYGKQGITSFVLAPGFTRTDMAQAFIDVYGEAHAAKDIVLDRLTEPEDVAPFVVLLASGLADHATGCTIDINAGSYVH